MYGYFDFCGPVIDWCEERKRSWENQLRRSAGKFRPMYLLFGGNDNVPIWRGGGVCSLCCAECRLVLIVTCRFNALNVCSDRPS